MNLVHKIQSKYELSKLIRSNKQHQINFNSDPKKKLMAEQVKICMCITLIEN